MDRPLLVLYGTQTGCAQEVAERLAREGKRRHFNTRVCGLGEYDKVKLPSEPLVIFAVSTTGQGEVPDNMKAFWRFLLTKNLPPNSLVNSKFAVFGLGDSSSLTSNIYAKYNFVGKMLNNRLLGLGATPVVRRGDGDDQHDLGMDFELDRWSKELWSSLLDLYPLPPGVEILPEKQKPAPRFRLTLQDSHSPLPKREPVAKNMIGHSQAYLFMATLAENKRITAPDWEQDVRHIEIDISTQSENKLSYQLGDVVYIQPQNSTTSAVHFLQTINVDPNSVLLSVDPLDSDYPVPNVAFPITMLDLCVNYLDFLGTPRRYFFELLSYFATQENEKERLEYFSSMEGQDDLRTYNHRERRTFAEVLQDFPSCRPPLHYLFDLIPPLLSRPFSISSSPSLHPSRIHVTAAIVRFTTPSRRLKMGVCSTWLSNLPPMHQVPIWVKASGTTHPNLDIPLVMVGPGTGCAMFRAFLQHRRHMVQCGAVLNKAIFFFGCRHADKDYLYQEEFEYHSKAVPQDRFYVAFSRDQPQKRYVQHLIKEHAEEVWDIVGAGEGYFYISGSADKMPKDVIEALREVVKDKGGISEEEAEVYIKKMEQKKRYQVETWSHS